MVKGDGTVQWGIMSTANIARASFLPGLRAAGGGEAYAVASRDAERAQAFARENGIERTIEGYDELLADEKVDAVYIPLPNALHARWTVAALRAGKTVLCEKPLCVSAEETEEVLNVARQASGFLWEAFVFPFHRQMSRLQELLDDGTIGRIREIQSSFTFRLSRQNDIRLSSALAGGALNDVGCYPVRLARLLLGDGLSGGVAMARWAGDGVDLEMQGVLGFGDGARLLFSCGMAGAEDTFTRVIGEQGEIRLTNPFHPKEQDVLEVRREDLFESESAGQEEPSFAPAVRHIHAVIRGEEKPRHVAIDDALGNAVALDLLHAAAERQP